MKCNAIGSSHRTETYDRQVPPKTLTDVARKRPHQEKESTFVGQKRDNSRSESPEWRYHLIDPNIVQATYTPLQIAFHLQRWATSRLLIDYGVLPDQNPKNISSFRRLLEKSQGVTPLVSKMFTQPRQIPFVPMVFLNGEFQKLLPISLPETKPIALFNVSDNWLDKGSTFTVRPFLKSFNRFYAEIAKHFTVVRVLVGRPDQLVPAIDHVMEMLPGVPLAVWSFTAHSNQHAMEVGKRLLLTTADVKAAIEERKKLPLEEPLSVGQTKIAPTSVCLTSADAPVMQEISKRIVLEGAIVLNGCFTGAGGDSCIARFFSSNAYGRIVYGSPHASYDLIPKVFYSSRSHIPQFLPFFWDGFFSSRPEQNIATKAYRNGEPKVTAFGSCKHPSDFLDSRFEYPAFVGPLMIDHENSGPAWTLLVQAIEGSERNPAFSGNVPLHATPDSLHRRSTRGGFLKLFSW